MEKNMTDKKFGRLEKLNLRDYWEREDTHFTPWLAEEENIALLGDTIGIELEVQDQEARVGPFRADILCRNTSDDTLVLIENQLEKTDHTHLGQLMTYGAGLDAVNLVWIVESFTEEHRAALDWLNRITDDTFHFFGLEVELWSIGGSVAAPKFNLVAKPNDWSKTVKEAAEATRSKLSPWRQQQVEFWAAFGARLTNLGAAFKAPKPYPSLWITYGLGRAGSALTVTFTQSDACIGIEVNNREHPTWYPQLIRETQAIEDELGFSLKWEERPDKKFAQITICKSSNMTDVGGWPDMHDWMIGQMQEIDKVFRPRLKVLTDDNA
jgi:hypothetical protein